jgi:hypothetical protein
MIDYDELKKTKTEEVIVFHRETSFVVMAMALQDELTKRANNGDKEAKDYLKQI